MAERFADRTVLVCGVGVAGAPAARALLARGSRVLLSDSAENETVAKLVAGGGGFFLSICSGMPGISHLVFK